MTNWTLIIYTSACKCCSLSAILSEYGRVCLTIHLLLSALSGVKWCRSHFYFQFLQVICEILHFYCVAIKTDMKKIMTEIAYANFIIWLHLISMVSDQISLECSFQPLLYNATRLRSNRSRYDKYLYTTTRELYRCDDLHVHDLCCLHLQSFFIFAWTLN